MVVAQMAAGGGANAKPVIVQPLSVTYTKLCGMPMGRQFRPYFAWYGDMDLGPHLWEAFTLGPFDVVVEFHEPVTLDHHGDRKKLAAYCEARSAEGVSRALLGEVSSPKLAETAPDPVAIPVLPPVRSPSVPGGEKASLNAE